MALTATGSASAAGPLAWSAPQPVAQDAPFTEPNTPSAASCPSPSVCFVLADANADTTEAQLISTSNADAVTPTWSAPGTIAAGYRIDQLSCPTIDFCAASGRQGAHGYFFTSGNPGAAAPEWTITTAPNTTDYFVALSCPTTVLCVAGDRDGKAWVSSDPDAASPTWSGPADVGIDGVTTKLTALSCAGTALCVFGDSEGDVIASTNPASASPSWHSPQSLVSESIQDITCPTTGICAALDESHDVFVSADPTAVSPTWNESSDVLNPPGFSLSWSISCPSTSLCAVTDVRGDLAVTGNPTAATPIWQTSSIPGSGFYPYLACPSASECLAADQTTEGTRGERTLDPTGNPPSWNVQTIDPGGRVRLEAISCAGTALCAILDDKGEISISTNPGSAIPNWSDPVEPAPSFTGLGDVSCPAADLCVATGYDGGFVESTNPTAPNPTWASQSGVDPSTILKISCSSSALCVAIDEAGHTVTSTNPSAPSPTWTRSAAAVETAASIETISCPSDSLCMIGDAGGNVLTSHDPGATSASWTGPINVSSNGFISDISCAGQVCMAIDGVAHFGEVTGWEVVVTADAGAESPAWKASTIPDPNAAELTDVSCATPTLCHAANDRGEVFTTTNPGGAKPAWSGPQAVAPVGILLDCTSGVLCGALTLVQAFTGIPPATPQYTISLVKAGTGAGSVTSAPGGIDCPTSCAQAFDDGTTVTLTATPAPFSLFAGWSGGACSGTAPCQIAVGSDVEVTASFAYNPSPVQRAVNVYLSGAGTVVSSPGGINCGSDCGDLFDEGTVVTLTATPALGWTFSGWSGAGCPGTGSCQFTVSSDLNITASFGGGGQFFSPGRTGPRAAALARCKKKFKKALTNKRAHETLTPQVKQHLKKKLRKCKRSANQLPV